MPTASHQSDECERCASLTANGARPIAQPASRRTSRRIRDALQSWTAAARALQPLRRDHPRGEADQAHERGLREVPRAVPGTVWAVQRRATERRLPAVRSTARRMKSRLDAWLARLADSRAARVP